MMRGDKVWTTNESGQRVLATVATWAARSPAIDAYHSISTQWRIDMARGKILSESVMMSSIRGQLALLSSRTRMDLDVESVEILKRQAKELVLMIQKAHYILLEED